MCCVISTWMVFTVPLTYLLLWFFRERNGKEVLLNNGICHVCGYDLRATPDRCPECGTVPPRGKPLS